RRGARRARASTQSRRTRRGEEFHRPVEAELLAGRRPADQAGWRRWDVLGDLLRGERMFRAGHVSSEFVHQRRSALQGVERARDPGRRARGLHDVPEMLEQSGTAMRTLAKPRREPGIWMTDAPEPPVGPNDVRIRIRKTAICG